MAEFVTSAEKGTWAGRFTLQVQDLWRQLQDELRDYGPTIKAKSLESAIRMQMGVVIGSELPVKKLHQAAYPTASKRPELIDLWDLSVPDTKVPVETNPVPSTVLNCTAQTREPLSDAELLELHVIAQEALSRGVTRYAMDCQLDLERALRSSLDLDYVSDALLDAIHLLAYPDPSGRPARLTAWDHDDTPEPRYRCSDMGEPVLIED
jgi:hypothetical protein